MASVSSFEMNDLDMLHQNIKSLYKLLCKKQSLHGFERVVIEFFRETSKLRGDANLMAALIKLRKKLISLSKNPFEKRVLEDFDFISWVESKIEKRPFAEIVRSKLKK